MLRNQNVNLSNEIIRAIRSVIGDYDGALHEPVFLGNELNYLEECINSTFVSSVGRYVDQFEEQLAEYTGASFAIAVVNGTAALHVALKVLGVAADDEVLIPALTFTATANAVVYCGATPHFVDSSSDDFGIDSNKLRDYLLEVTEQRGGLCINKKTGRVVRAIIPMHAFGLPSDIDGLCSISRDFNITMVEDAAESLGSFYKNKHTGTFGKVGAVSFNGNKIITTGGGGALLTNDESLAKRIKHITTTAKMPHRWEFHHDEVGYNYRMPNLNAAIGCAQLERLPEYLLKKRQLFNAYLKAFENIGCVKIKGEQDHCASNYWLQCMVLDESIKEKRDEILHATNLAGIMTRPVWNLLCGLEHFSSCPSMDLSAARLLEQCIINIPSGVGVGIFNGS